MLKRNTMSEAYWHNYGLWKLRTQLIYLEGSHAQVHEVHDRSGKVLCSFIEPPQIEIKGTSTMWHYLDEKYEIHLLDKHQYLNELKNMIKSYEKKIENYDDVE